MAATGETKAKKSVPGRITASSTAEYFSKNLQQVGFSSPTKAVLTTLKEAVDNSLDACEEHGILPDVKVFIDKVGAGSLKNTDQVLIRVEDNGPGIPFADVPKVFGEYLASSKFGRGRCSRGQQGIGISAATTWAMQTSAMGVKVVTRQAKQRKAISCRVEVDLKNNRGVVKDRQDIDWDVAHGTSVEFVIDGRIQLNGESGILAFLRANVLVNPHLRLTYQLPDMEEVTVERVATVMPQIPEATEPHPHTMKLGEFLAHARLFGRARTRQWLKTGFSRIGDKAIDDMAKAHGIKPALLDQVLTSVSEEDFKKLFVALQNTELRPPSTSSVLSVGEEALAKSILRLGSVDFYSVVSRKPTICDFKPVQIEVAIARLEEREGVDSEAPVQVLRFANRVPLQFDKAGCAIVKAITSINWKPYGIRQPRGSLPQGPYIMAVSVVSPFIKFKNASKETVDASDELVEEFRRALMKAGQRLSRHLRREFKEAELEDKIQHIERFAPILVEGLVRIVGAPESRKEKAEQGLMKILGRDTKEAAKELDVATAQLKEHLEERKKRLGDAVLELPETVGGLAGEMADVFEDEAEADDDRAPPKVAKESVARVKKTAKAKPSAKAKQAGKAEAKSAAKAQPAKKAKPAAAKAKAAVAKAKAAPAKAKSGKKAAAKPKAPAKTKAASKAKAGSKTAAPAKKKSRRG